MGTIVGSRLLVIDRALTSIAGFTLGPPGYGNPPIDGIPMCGPPPTGCPLTKTYISFANQITISTRANAFQRLQLTSFRHRRPHVNLQELHEQGTHATRLGRSQNLKKRIIPSHRQHVSRRQATIDTNQHFLVRIPPKIGVGHYIAQRNKRSSYISLQMNEQNASIFIC